MCLPEIDQSGKHMGRNLSGMQPSYRWSTSGGQNWTSLGVYNPYGSPTIPHVLQVVLARQSAVCHCSNPRTTIEHVPRRHANITKTTTVEMNVIEKLFIQSKTVRRLALFLTMYNG